MEIEVHEAGAGMVVRLRGDAGVSEARALEECVLHLAARRPAYVTFDLGELGSISSLAMGVLAAYRRAAVRAGARVCLSAGLQPAVREALDRAELTALFEVARDPGSATPTNEGQKWYPSVHEVQRIYKVAWEEIVPLVPPLEGLLWRARMAGASCRTLTDVSRAFRPLREELAGLVGFGGKHRDHPVLGSTAAYEVAYWKLYDAVAGLVPRRPAENASPSLNPQ
jgi:anti-anti-sigma factor